MSQPVWKMIANLGDVNPLDHGGYFVLIDETGVYDAEAELLVAPEEGGTYEVFRFILEKCTCDGVILSDNKYHPLHPAWFAIPETMKQERPQDITYLSNVCGCVGIERSELVRLFCSEDPIERAEAYRTIGQYHGWNSLDDYPLTLTRDEAEKRVFNLQEVCIPPGIGRSEPGSEHA